MQREVRQLQLRLGQLQSSSQASLPGQQDGGPQHAQQGGGDDGSGTAGGTGAAAGEPAGSQQQLDMRQLAFPLRPIGILRSCFSRRNGTPRQPLLVPAARAALTLRPEMSGAYFEGLQEYSHCWVLYIFHENTDLQRLWQEEPYAGVPAKIRVPRLDGGKMGVFATRSPHRPCPIGLSVAQVLSVDGRTLVLGGADIVDGSPVLDIKPYVPFCDSVPAAAAPHWVAMRAEDEPLSIGVLRISPEAEAELRTAWWRRGQRSLFASFDDFRGLVEQVLSRDIRSVTQRIKVPQRAQQGGPAALHSGGAATPQRQAQQEQQQAGQQQAGQQQAGQQAQQQAQQEQQQAGERQEGYWKVVLDGIELSYDVEAGSRDVLVRGAWAVLTD
ncbi:hypothetical protein COHA_003421 [Chlorella ohadii]|uniref:TsaA-like domain-containing protein n=1 Tax=Chlorella ohadii TaxID=2649997 RepID=A0AAD5DVP4_9CHLO|nr:hypothetical protein COHA_003421 [Chlorella ohadii]